MTKRTGHRRLNWRFGKRTAPAAAGYQQWWFEQVELHDSSRYIR